MKIKQKLMILMCISAILFSGCDNSALKSGYGDDKGEQVQSESQQQVPAVQVNDVAELTNDSFDEKDMTDTYQDSNASKISFSGSGAQTDGEGVKADGGTVTISKAGTYIVSGKISDGQIVVDAKDKDVVQIVLNNAEITSKKNSAVYVKNAEKTIITLAEGSKNTLTDAKKYTYGNKKDTYEGAIFCESNLSINGNGQVIVKANHGNGISSSKDLKIAAGIFNITSEKDGIYAAEGISIKNGSYIVNAGGNGMAAGTKDKNKGFVGIECGNFTVTSGNDSICTCGNVYIINGSFTATAGSGSILSSDSKKWGKWSDGTSAKGISAGGTLEIYGGAMNLDTSDDAVSAAKGINIYTGSVNITSGDDGIVTGGQAVISGGSVNISNSYEGLIAGGASFKSGYMSIISKDDGINIGGGNDNSVSKRPGKNDLDMSTDNQVSIESAFLNIVSEGDGMDVKGDIKITSGSVQIFASDNGKDAILECSGKAEVDGGNFIGTSSENDGTTLSDSSKQNIAVLNYKKEQSEKSVAYLEDTQQKVLLSAAPMKKFSYVVVSKPELKGSSIVSWYKAQAKGNSTASGEIGADAVQKDKKLNDFTVKSGINQVEEK